MKLTDVLDYVVTRYSHLLEIPEAIYGIFPTIYNYCATKFDVVYNTPKCVHCIADDLFAMLKREADAVIAGSKQTKLSNYSCHDTSILRSTLKWG